MKRIIEKVKNHPGIYRTWTVDNKGTRSEPKRGKYVTCIDLGGRNDVKRRRIKRTFETFSEAKEFRVQISSKKDVFRQTLEKQLRLKFSAVVVKWSEQMLPHVQPTTQTRYRSYLKLFEWFNDFDVEDIDPSTIDAWIGHVKSPEKLATMHPTRCGFEHEFTVLRQILNYYASRFNRNYRLPFQRDHSKMLKVREKESIKKDLSIAEFNRFKESLFALTSNGPHEVIYHMALMQYAIYGRVQEAAALHVEDFDFERQKIYVRRKIQWARVKGEQDRTASGSKANGGKEIPMSEFAASVFREWQLRSGIRSGLLFRIHGAIVTYRQIAYRYDEALKRAGLPFKGTHLIRHASLSEHYATCKDLKATAVIAGHSDLRATDRYAKVRDEQMVKTQRQMDEKLRYIFEK